MTTLVAGLVIFFAVHTFTMFRGAREQLVAKLGALPYRGLYSLISIAGFVLLVMGYADAPRIAVWAPPIWMRHITMLLMLPVFILLPAMYLPGYIKARVKNPMLIAVKTLGVRPPSDQRRPGVDTVIRFVSRLLRGRSDRGQTHGPQSGRGRTQGGLRRRRRGGGPRHLRSHRGLGPRLHRWRPRHGFVSGASGA